MEIGLQGVVQMAGQHRRQVLRLPVQQQHIAGGAGVVVIHRDHADRRQPRRHRHLVERLTHRLTGELFAHQIGAAAPAEKTQRRHRAQVAIDLHQIIELVAQQAGAGAHQGHHPLSLPQFPGRVDAIILRVLKLIHMAAVRQRVTALERKGHHPFGGPQTLALERGLRQTLLQPARPRRRRGRVPGAHQGQPGPKSGKKRAVILPVPVAQKAGGATRARASGAGHGVGAAPPIAVGQHLGQFFPPDTQGIQQPQAEGRTPHR